MNDYLFKIITGGNLSITDSHLSSTISCLNSAIIFNDGGTFESLGGKYSSYSNMLINETGKMYIYDGTFTVSVGAIVKNNNNAELMVSGGEFLGVGTEFSVGIQNSGEFVFEGGEFKHLDCDIELYNTVITLTSNGIKTKDYIYVEKYDSNNNLTAGAITNKVPAIAKSLTQYFLTFLPNSGIYATSYGEIAICTHLFNKQTIISAPDCEKDGVVIYSCSNCEHSYSEHIAKLGHNYGEWIEEIAPTTDEYGIVAHYNCINCNKNFDSNKKEIYSIYIGKTGVSVLSIQKINSINNKDIYQINFSDNTFTTFEIINGLNGDKGDVGAIGNGIESILKTSSNGTIDNYEILFTDGTITTFSVKNGQNGVGIEKVEKIYEDESKQIIQITYTNGTTSQFELQNNNNIKNIKILLYIILGIIIVVIISGLTYFIIKKTKNKKKNVQV